MSNVITIATSGPLHGSVRPPGSKSITNRALVCAALADGVSTLHGPLDSDDTRVMIAALRQLGLVVEWEEGAAAIRVVGCRGRFPHDKADIFVANSGTTMRFLASMLPTGIGTFRLSGVPRMHQRPIGDLLQSLRQLGAEIHSESEEGYPPVQIQATGLIGGTARIRGDVSSQFLSGLLMAAPYAREPVVLEVEGPLVSQPYVAMTLRVMQQFGVAVAEHEMQRFSIDSPASYQAVHYAIEPDASAASYFWAAAAVSGGRVTVEGLGCRSLQGDVGFCDCLQEMGCSVDRSDDQITVTAGPLHGIDVDMNEISDTVQTLAAVALFADGPTTIRGVAHIRFKETDRIGDLASELRKLGADVTETDDGLRIAPRPLHGAEIETYADHRMAMSLALVGLRVPNVRIRNPECTRKTYPNFFADMQRLCESSAAN